jgi:hypothetical protein
MALFKCPECESLSHSDRKASYFWCACGCPLTAADAVPGLPHELTDSTPPAPPPPEVEEPPAIEVELIAEEPEPEPEEHCVSPAVKARTRRRPLTPS